MNARLEKEIETLTQLAEERAPVPALSVQKTSLSLTG